MNIHGKLIEKFGFKESGKQFDNFEIYNNGKFDLITLESKSIFAENLDEIEADVLIFGSSHRAVSGRPSLTVHCVGNWGIAEMGGNDREIVKGSAVMVRNYLRKLNEVKEREQLDYEVGLEVTHHGPYTQKMLVYVEHGSCEEHWGDLRASEAIAETIAEGTKAKKENEIIAIGIGGGHYAPEFTKLLLRTDYAMAHICPKYALGDFDKKMLGKMIEATEEKVEVAVVDWKGLGEHKGKVKTLLEEKGLEIKRVRKLLK